MGGLIDEVKRIYHDTKQAISECNFLSENDLKEISLTPIEEQLIMNVNGCQISLIKAATLLRELHARFLRSFVLSAFDLTWDMITTPKRFEYAKQKELELYNSLMGIANLKQDEIKLMIRETVDYVIEVILQSMSSANGDRTGCCSCDHDNDDNGTHSLNCSHHLDHLRQQHQDRDQDQPSIESSFEASLEIIPSRSEMDLYRQEIQESVLQQLNASIASKLIGSVESLRNSYVGTLERCLASLEQNCLVNNEPPHALLALRQILNAAYRVEVNVQSSTSVLRVFWEKMKKIVSNSLPNLNLSQIFSSSSSTSSCQATIVATSGNSGGNSTNTSSCSGSSIVSFGATSRNQSTTTATKQQQQHKRSLLRASGNGYIINDHWKRQQALDIIENLSESRLAKSICSQFRARLKASHEKFLQSMKDLEMQHATRLQQTEELCLRVRKLHAPRMAKLALESTSLIDLILYGMPFLEREIGRGQYGVVYDCESWAGHSPCAVKSVVPPDDKHWYDLAMEFYYTRCIPEHERIVNIFGSVIDHSYGSGSTPAVLLIMERLNRDLYSAIKLGLDWLSRLQVAIDVVEGIRFLHNQGLVHRDIKLKNILLDGNNRAKITDLGFCKPEAMMSGSVVGTPIHMSPELFSGRYDNSVDVYAFGILFWYICAGHVKLPHIFEQCQTRDQLWNCVRRGVRPERLPQFDNECWQLMVQCWDGDKTKRPHLGDVEIRLRQIHARYT